MEHRRDEEPTAQTRPPRVLVVCHEASRTGAPRVAIEVLKALGDGDWDRHVVLRWPGPLKDEIESTGANVSIEPLRRLRALRRWRHTRSLTASIETWIAWFVIRRVRPDVIWCNSVTSACYVRPGRRMGAGVILHAHETKGRIADVLARYHLEEQWPSTILVGCAPDVCVSLANATGRPLDEVVCLPSVPDANRIAALARSGSAPLPRGVVVGGCGTPDSRKGVDLWLEIAARVAPRVADLDPHFVWIGGDAPVDLVDPNSATGLGTQLTFTGSLDNPYPWLEGLDVFTLTSRADPFPLVVLEAMNLGRAVVAFGVGDVPTQIGDAGIVVPPLDVARAADAIVSLLRDPEERSRLGSAAAARAREDFSLTGFFEAVRSVAAAAHARSASTRSTAK